MSFDPDRIINLIKIKGPIIPVQISKEINQNILFTSAMLSELVSKSKLKVSHVKVGGGSPLYYLPGQEPQLTRFVSNLNEKDKRSYLMLKENSVLRDNDLDALSRFSLRQIKDFAVPLQVSVNEHKELFWRYFLTSNQEAEPKIKSILGIKEPESEKIQEAAVPVQNDPPLTPQIKEEKPKPREPEMKPTLEKQERLAPKIPKKRGPVKKPDVFYGKILSFFERNRIKILGEEDIKKGEYSFIIEVNSIVGLMTYYCIAKNKKRINEGDISTLSIKAKSKNLPPLLLTPGIPTKSAQILLENELKGLNIKQV